MDLMKVFEFLDRGQRLRRGQPSEMQLDDRDLKNQILINQDRRSELSSTLGALNDMDAIKKRNFDYNLELGGLSEDERIAQSQREREEDRRDLVIRRSAENKRLQQNPQDPEIDISPEESALYKEHGVHIPPGMTSASTLAQVVALRGHEMSADAAVRAAGVRASGAQGSGSADDPATLEYWSKMVDRDPSVLGRIPSRKGNDVRSAVIAYRAHNEVDLPVPMKIRETEAGFADAEAGLDSIERAFKKYNDAHWYNTSPAKLNRARYAYTTQAKNYASLLGRAREKGIITQPDYERFLDLVYPGLLQATVDPELAQESLDNARSFLTESKARRLSELKGPNNAYPGDSEPVDLAEQARQELARRRGGNR